MSLGQKRGGNKTVIFDVWSVGYPDKSGSGGTQRFFLKWLDGPQEVCGCCRRFDADDRELLQVINSWCAAIRRHVGACVCDLWRLQPNVMIYIPSPGRVENPMVDGAVNPSLGVTALLAPGIDRIENQMPTGKRKNRSP